MLNIIVYTDGACSGNPGRGGAAWIITEQFPSGHHAIYQSGSAGYQRTTNNRMELIAAADGIHHAHAFVTDMQAKHPDQKNEDYTITVRTDSALVVGLMNDGWKAKANLDLVDILNNTIDAAGRSRVFFEKVKGHSDDDLNDEADRLAVQASKLPLQLVDVGFVNATETTAADRLLSALQKEYEQDSDVCAAEFLAGKAVPAGVSFEEAFQAYIAMMKTIEGDRFVQIREKEIVEL